ncbi:hypothetical protein [Singulisphaera sp. GP187]|uniref:hypothetical protein n=1 Tax=Singulisphaera sp. GP187 TaxID=1882752 RepID=UPI000940697F|nr:hypothetical protein [Singulisphaera sp. GP187]
MKYIYISCLDSLNDFRGNSIIDSILAASGVPYYLFGKGVVACLPIPRDTVDKLFFGFDEAWFFGSKPPSIKPCDIYIVEPCPIDHLESSLVCDWMQQSGCILGLGDGLELNYVTTDAMIAHFMEGQ